MPNQISNKRVTIITPKGDKGSKTESIQDDTSCSFFSSSSAAVSLSHNDTELAKNQHFDESRSSGSSTGDMSTNSSSSQRGSKESGETSWSDSDGSTYVSGMSEGNSPVLNESENNNNTSGGWTEKDMEDLDAVLDEDLESRRSSRGGGKARETKINQEANSDQGHANEPMGTVEDHKQSHERTLIQGINYYSTLDEASTNSNVSTFNPLQKEDTKSIFCRRLVPLDIPVENAEEEISAVSIVNEPSQVISPVICYLRKTKNSQPDETRLADVDYLSMVDIASDNGDISTVGYTIPYRVAHEAFHQTTFLPSVTSESMNSMEVPRLIEPSNSSPSVLSSLDSESFEENTIEESFIDGESDDATRPAKETPVNVQAIFKKYRHIVGDLSVEEKVSPKPPKKKKKVEKVPVEQKVSKKIVYESAADVRIRNLKKKIEELKKEETSTGKKSQSQDIKSSNKSGRSSMDTDQIDTRIEELTRTTNAIKKNRGSAYVDLTGGLKLRDNDGVNQTQSESYHKELAPVKIKISGQNSRLTFGENTNTQLEIPSGGGEDDDVSTMMGENDDFEAPPDMEKALRIAIERKKIRIKRSKQLTFGRIKREILYYIEKGQEKMTVAPRFGQPAGPIEQENESKSGIGLIWAKFMNGRSQGEAALIIVIAISLFILFILLIVVISGR